MKQEKPYVFDSIHTVAKYLYSLSPTLSPIKLHKSLYFLFAYYGALYAKNEEEGNYEGNVASAPLLFEAEFEAWSYGSVHRDVYFQSKESDYLYEESIQKAVHEVAKHEEAKQFIDEMFEQINSVSDFSLVFRNKQDNSWEEAYEKGKIHIISNETLLHEYRERYL